MQERVTRLYGDTFEANLHYFCISMHSLSSNAKISTLYLISYCQEVNPCTFPEKSFLILCRRSHNRSLLRYCRVIFKNYFKLHRKTISKWWKKGKGTSCKADHFTCFIHQFNWIHNKCRHYRFPWSGDRQNTDRPFKEYGYWWLYLPSMCG